MAIRPEVPFRAYETLASTAFLERSAVANWSWRPSEAGEQWAILCRHPHNAVVAQQSVTPGFLRGARNTASGRETAVQGTDWPDLLRFAGAVTCGCGDAVGVLAVVSVPSVDSEILRRIDGARLQTRQWECGPATALSTDQPVDR